MRRLQEILDYSYKISIPDINSCDSCNTLKAIIVMIQDKIKDMTNCVIYSEHSMKIETSVASIQTEDDNNEVENLKDKLASSEKTHYEEKVKLEKLVK